MNILNDFMKNKNDKIGERNLLEMHGKVWMFSNLIDDEDIEFMQHEFISYKQAMDYYELGYKPIVGVSR